MKELKKINILGVLITTSKKEEILEYLLEKSSKNAKPLVVVTPNPEIIMFARKNPEFAKILNEADVALPDGVGVVIAARILQKVKIPRIAGVDFMLDLVKGVSKDERGGKTVKNGIGKNPKSIDSIGLFGGQPGVAELVSECLQKKYSGTHVSYASSVWDEAVMESKALAVLFVALGHPKQEKWIFEHKDKLKAKIVMGVGGSFDFLSGRVRRAPTGIQKLGLEWLFRLLVQPWRWKRQLALIEFTFEVGKQIISSRKSQKIK